MVRFPLAQVSLALGKIHSAFSSAGVNIPPSEEEGLSVYLHPNEALNKGSTFSLAASASGGGPGDAEVDGTNARLALAASLSATAISLTQLPSSAPLDPGASWAAAHQLPTPLGPLGKAIEDWSVHDVQVWNHPDL